LNEILKFISRGGDVSPQIKNGILTKWKEEPDPTKAVDFVFEICKLNPMSKLDKSLCTTKLLFLSVDFKNVSKKIDKVTKKSLLTFILFCKFRMELPQEIIEYIINCLPTNKYILRL